MRGTDEPQPASSRGTRTKVLPNRTNPLTVSSPHRRCRP
jgi:hypothetical protein